MQKKILLIWYNVYAISEESRYADIWTDCKNQDGQSPSREVPFYALVHKYNFDENWQHD